MEETGRAAGVTFGRRDGISLCGEWLGVLHTKSVSILRTAACHFPGDSRVTAQACNRVLSACDPAESILSSPVDVGSTANRSARLLVSADVVQRFAFGSCDCRDVERRPALLLPWFADTPCDACRLGREAHRRASRRNPLLYIEPSQERRRPQKGRKPLPNPICVQNVKMAPIAK